MDRQEKDISIVWDRTSFDGNIICVAAPRVFFVWGGQKRGSLLIIVVMSLGHPTDH